MGRACARIQGTTGGRRTGRRRRSRGATDAGDRAYSARSRTGVLPPPAIVENSTTGRDSARQPHETRRKKGTVAEGIDGLRQGRAATCAGPPRSSRSLRRAQRRTPPLPRRFATRTTDARRGPPRWLQDEATPGHRALSAEDHASRLRPRDRRNRARIELVDSPSDHHGPGSLCAFVSSLLKTLQERGRKSRPGFGSQLQRFFQELRRVWCHELILLQCYARSLQSSARIEQPRRAHASPRSALLRCSAQSVFSRHASWERGVVAAPGATECRPKDTSRHQRDTHRASAAVAHCRVRSPLVPLRSVPPCGPAG